MKLMYKKGMKTWILIVIALLIGLSVLHSVEAASVTDDLTQVAGEVGDVLYLALKMCNTLGLNPDDVIRMKIARNEDKYGQQSERDVAKREWKEKGGDRAWYEEYLLTTAIIEED